MNFLTVLLQINEITRTEAVCIMAGTYFALSKFSYYTVKAWFLTFHEFDVFLKCLNSTVIKRIITLIIL